MIYTITMLLETPNNFNDFELLDTGDGYRLERWHNVVLQRPDPQIIWQRSLPDTEWDKSSAIFKSASRADKGQWEIKHPLPTPWTVAYDDLKFLLKLSPFKHTGLFAEQAAQWNWAKTKIQNTKYKILNLFAYTGGATMVLAKAGCFVTHVDASKPAIAWAKENHAMNKLPSDSVRWILDDAVKFVKRELKRGAKYDGIIMDPPAFGHSPTGKTWKFNDDLPGLLTDCVQLLSDDARFLIINGYATNSSALALNNLLEDAINHRGGSPRLGKFEERAEAGKIEFGELCLQQKNSRMISTGIFARWSI